MSRRTIWIWKPEPVWQTISKEKKGFILVSHDRLFLDACVDHILSINRTNIEVQNGNFSTWFTNFQRQQDFELMQNEKLKKDISRMKQAARKTQSWSDAVEKTKVGKVDKGYIGHKAEKMMRRSKNIERRQQKAIEEKSRLLQNFEEAEGLKLTPLSYGKETLAVFSEVVPVYDGRETGSPVSFHIQRGDRIVLDGKNGAGKSSLLKLLAGQEISFRGTLTVGSGLVISYVPQDASGVEGDMREFIESSQIEESLFKTILRKMDFSRDQFEQDMKMLSAGQKKKLLLARSLCQQAHLYVWDEPLNYIDLYSRMQLEGLIQEYAPTMIFVEHDRAFREAIATKTIQL